MDLAKVGISYVAMGSGMSSGPPGAGLILHREDQASRSKEAWGHQLGTQPSSVLWEISGTQVRMRAWTRAL